MHSKSNSFDFLVTARCFLALLAFLAPGHARAGDYFTITIVDEQTGRGVPLVELETVNQVCWWTDSNGIIAFDEPGLMEQEVYFHVRSHGYEYHKDMFGNRGVKLKPTHGGSATIKIKRLNIAERLYRITGEGIYRDSVLVGHPVPTQQPLLNGQVMGQDTVIATPYRGKIYWFWGDTDRVGYPLGNFGASGATSELPGHGGLDPNVGVDLTYFVDKTGFSKQMCSLPGPAAHWIESLLTVPDEQGVERLVARVANHTHLGEAESWDLMEFNDEKAVFEPMQHWNIHEGHESSHPFRARVEGVEYFYLFPNWRVKVDLKSFYDLKNYEAMTCVVGDGKVHGKETELDRDAAGRPRYQWRAGADRLSPNRVRELITADKLKPEESWIDLHDYETGARILAGGGSVYWSDFRHRWIMLYDSTKAGEIWFVEGDTPVGPWVYARRVVSHDNYNFYNPTQHPFFDQEGGRLIYFEGTYSDFFSGARARTPRYDYNQIMYCLALDDPRLALPAPVYRLKSGGEKVRYLMREGVDSEKAWESIEEIAFFAIPSARSRAGLVPIYAVTQNSHTVLQAGLNSQPPDGSTPLFLALPATCDSAAQSVDGRWQCTAKTTGDGESQFSLQLKQRGTAVETVNKEDAASAKGSFESGRLSLTLTTVIDSHKYSLGLTAELCERKLAGDWKQLDGDLRGTWSADWVDPALSEDKSPAVVALYEYQSIDGRRIYSTNPELDSQNLKRTPVPLCRIWRNPMAVLVLDAKSQPVPFQQR